MKSGTIALIMKDGEPKGLTDKDKQANKEFQAAMARLKLATSALGPGRTPKEKDQIIKRLRKP